MRRRVTYAFQSALVLAMFGAGFAVGAYRKPTVDRAVAAAPASNVTNQNAPKLARGDAARPSTDAPQSESVPRSPTFKTLETILALNERLQQKFTCRLVEDERLNDDFVTLFDLSPPEADALRAEFAAARERIADLEAQHARIEAAGDGRYLVFVPPFPEDGDKVHDHLVQSIRSILGEERFSFYTRLNPTEFDRDIAFADFGLGEMTIDVYDYRDERGNPTGGGSSSFDKNTGRLKRKHDHHPEALHATFPRIYEKLVAAGALPKETAEAASGP